MVADDFRIGLRQLLREPTYSTLAVLGMGIAIAATLLVAVLLQEMVLPDQRVPDPDRLVRVELKLNIPGRSDDWFAGAPFSFRDDLVQAKAPISAAARVLTGDWSVRAGAKVLKMDGAFADPEIIDLFGLQATRGDLASALSRPDGMALTEDAAERLFGPGHGLGQQVRLNGQTLTVMALVARQSGNSELKFDALVKFDAPANAFPRDMMSGYVAGRVFARLLPGASEEQIGLLAQTLFDHAPARLHNPPAWTANGRKAAFLRAVSLSRLALYGAESEQNRLRLGGLAIAALTMLALSAINYVNLTTVRTLRRQREIGIRKSLGAGARSLATQLLTESLLVGVLAGLLGLLLAQIFAQPFLSLMEQHIDRGLLTPLNLLSLAIGCVLLGFATGIYPARIALRMNCAELMAGRAYTENASGRWLRRAMTTLQFAAAISASMVAIVVLWQGYHSRHLQNGFRSEGMLTVDLPDNAKPELATALNDALARESGVTGVTRSSGVPGRNDVGELGQLRTGGPERSVRLTRVGADFFDVYEIHILAGRLEAPVDGEQDKAVVLDLTAANVLGFAKPQDAVGKTVTQSRTAGDVRYRVVAVTVPVRQESARIDAIPHYYVLSNTVSDSVTVRADDMLAGRRALERVWPRYFPDEVVRIATVDEFISKHYKHDRQIGILVAGASLIALFLASFGLYALAAYTVRLKTQEIVVRKLYGASRPSIAWVFVREFLALLAVGAVVGLPLGFALSESYLSGFFVRAPVGLWPAGIALFAGLLLSGAATIRHTFAATAARPTQALQGNQ